jgi:hypothetical protein
MSEETKEIEIENEVAATQEETVQEETDSQPTAPEVELSELDKAVQARMGHFQVNIGYDDLKYIKNLLNNKVEWKGPNEAYLMLTALLNLSFELKNMEPKGSNRETVMLPSTTLESINFFLNRVTGKGEESAHRIFAVSMLLRPAMEEIKKLDELIEKLQSEEK